MRQRMSIGSALTGMLLAIGSGAFAQEAPLPPPEAGVLVVQGPGPEGATMAPPFAERIELLGLEGMHGGKVVTGSPFSGVAVSETTQTLADGNRITRKTQASLFRDSEGRVRREMTLPAIGPLAAPGQPKTFVSINDPVANVHYMLNPEEKTAQKMTAPDFKMKGAPPNAIQYRKQAIADGNLQTEDLGAQTISGLLVQGTRYTNAIPAGQIGNEKPITIVSEQWYSNDLQMTVMSKRSDPRFGDTSYTLTNIQRSEPAAALFTVPADYTVQEGGPHGKANFVFRQLTPASAPPEN